MNDLPKNFNPTESESSIYNKWVMSDYFRAKHNSKPKFSMIMPPPNVTGQLHMGHALDYTIQDIISRFKRMQGFDVLWLPGLDHASISTELKVVKQLSEQGITKEQLGREEFIKHAFAWKEKYGNTIVEQIKRLGCSCDWSCLKFTMDEDISEAVVKVFVDLYNKGMIYKGSRLINWCPRCKTTISDAEVEHIERESHLWYIKYRIENTDEYLTFATTRPETLLGDTAIAVNPKDKRYTDFVGMYAIVPFVNRKIPIIADEYVDMEFGSGVVKITPGHDPNDFEIGKRHDLPIINIFNDDGTLNNNAGPYSGKKNIRNEIINDLGDLFVKSEKITHAVCVHERCSEVIEPMIKPQWFVKMHDMAQKAIDVYKNDELQFIPERFGKTYLQWLENINDWCISRQLWWGHRIPAFYCHSCKNVMVKNKPPTTCDKCNSHDIYQDEDILDTWFSSALWPFATLGWPDETSADFVFYPNDVLVTGYDIIFFWVVRMVFSALEHTKQLPFKDVLIHGLIRDEHGRKMSKSLGNGVDPIEAIDKYGADVLRMTLVAGSTPGNDLKFYWEKLESNRMFINKIWNATRFILMNNITENELDVFDMWILSRKSTLVSEITKHMEDYEHGLAISKLCDFIWTEFCDWYIEICKQRGFMNSVIKTVLIDCLKLLHPFIPFVTEELFMSMNNVSVMESDWPKATDKFEDVEYKVEYIKLAVRGIRNLRAEMNVHPARKTKAYTITQNDNVKQVFIECSKMLGLAGVSEMVFVNESVSNAVSIVLADAVMYLSLDELIDVESERERLLKDRSKYESELLRAKHKLSNAEFIQNAPNDIVQKERIKLEQFTNTINKIDEQLELLKGGV